MNKRKKRGKLSQREKEYIEKYCDGKTDQEIADKFRRPIDQITNYRVMFVGRGVDMSVSKAEEAKVRHELHDRPEWKYFTQQFTDDELSLFEYTYIKFMKQFKDDVLVTEEKQIFHAIELEIFLNRNKRERRRAIEEIEKMRKLIDQEMKKSGDDIDKNYVLSLETQLNASTASNYSRTIEYKTLLDKYESIMKILKATRDQRLDKIESSNQSFIGLLKSLEDSEIREQEGRQMELLRLSMEKEREKLSQYHEYIDKQVDRPLLNAETVMLDEEK